MTAITSQPWRKSLTATTSQPWRKLLHGRDKVWAKGLGTRLDSYETITEHPSLHHYCITPYLLDDDGEGGHDLGVAVGTGRLVVGLVAAPAGHYLLVIEQDPGAEESGLISKLHRLYAVEWEIGTRKIFVC